MTLLSKTIPTLFLESPSILLVHIDCSFNSQKPAVCTVGNLLGFIQGKCQMFARYVFFGLLLQLLMCLPHRNGRWRGHCWSVVLRLYVGHEYLWKLTGNDNRDACNSSPAAAEEAVIIGAHNECAHLSNHGSMSTFSFSWYSSFLVLAIYLSLKPNKLSNTTVKAYVHNRNIVICTIVSVTGKWQSHILPYEM